MAEIAGRRKVENAMTVEIIEWMRASFEVDAERGSLIWRHPPKNHSRMIGREAGSLRRAHNGKRYCHVKKDRRSLKRGHLIFLWVYRRWPTPCLDHIDGNSENDGIANLREATITQNAWNHKKRARRIKLPMGVRLIVKSGRYQARIGLHGKQLHLGAYDTPEAAHTAYVAKRKELYREWA
jgi:hypothetical protein